MQPFEKEKKISEFDLGLIPYRMQGWSLEPDRPGYGLRTFTRELPDNKSLNLRVDPILRTADFWERNIDDNQITFSIRCEEITQVVVPPFEETFGDGRFVFIGNVHYKITYNGRVHEVRLPKQNSTEQPIARAEYKFEE